MKVKYVVGCELDPEGGARIRDIYPSDQGQLFQSLIVELLFPDHVQARDEDWTMGTLYRTPDGFSYTQHSKLAVKYYVYGVVRTRRSSRLSRSWTSYAVAVVTPEPFYPVLQPVLADASEAYAQNASVAVLAALYHAVYGINLKHMPLFTHCEKRILQMNKQPSLFCDYYATQCGESPATASSKMDTHLFSATATMQGKQYALRVPTYLENHNAGQFAVRDLLQKLLRMRLHNTSPLLTPYGKDTPPLLVLWLAMLTGRRVVVAAGSSTPAARLCELVLATSFFGGAGGLLDTHRWTFPYATLGFLQQHVAAGPFLAGVTSSEFGGRPDAWDVAVDLEKHVVAVSPNIASPVPPQPLLPRDTQFLTELQDSMVATEAELREVVVSYTTDILRSMASEMLTQRACERAQKPHMFVGGFGYCWADDAEINQFARVYGPAGTAWLVQPSFEHFMTSVALDVWPQQHKPVVDLKYHYDRLRRGNLSTEAAAGVYQVLCGHINDVVDITQFLACTNSIYYLVLGVYHPSSDVRDATAQLVLRIQKHSAGALYFLALPPFHSIGLTLAAKERQVLANGF